MNLDATRALLLDRLAALEARSEAIRNDLGKEYSSDSEEQAIERENDEVLSAIGEEALHEIGEIKSALRRIESGDYGVCRVCGEAIPAGRLTALPYATRCVKCSSAAD